MGQLFRPRHEMLLAVLARVRERVLVRGVPLLVVLEVVLVLEPHPAELARVLEELLLVPVHFPLVGREVLGRVELFPAHVARVFLVRQVKSNGIRNGSKGLMNGFVTRSFVCDVRW